MIKRFKQTMTALSLALSIVLLFASSAFAAAIDVSYKILSTSDKGGIVYDNTVTVEEGSTVFAALQQVSNDRGIPIVHSGSGANLYVSAINGAMENKYPGEYSGWMYRVNNELLSYAADDPNGAVLHAGDDVTWYYAVPAETYFTKIDNTTVSGSTLIVNVKAEKFDDVINWDLSGFTGLEGATVVAKQGGVERTATTNSNGDAVFTGLGSGTWQISVKDKYFTSGALNYAIEHTKSSVHTVTIP